MSDENRHEPGTEESTNTADVREAIERAREVSQHNDAIHSTDNPHSSGVPENDATQPEEVSAASGFTAEQHASINTEQMPIQELQHMPTAGTETPVEQPVAPLAAPQPPEPSPVTPFAQAQGVQDPAGSPTATTVPAQPMPVTPDHPMAPLYFQQPSPPTLKANRLAGILISLLATAVFALIYAGLLAAWRAPLFPPSTFLAEGLLPYLTSLGFILPVVAFFVAMAVLVLIFNRSGWWVYVIFGIIVAALVWGAAGAGYSLSPELADAEDLAREYGLSLEHIASFALTIPGIMAGLAAREVAIWFGAWIGARGRRVKRRNAEAMQEYEAKLQELQTPQTT